MNIIISSEPSQLPFGVAAGVLFECCDGLFKGLLAI